MILLETLDNLSQNEFYKFRWLLQFTCFQKSLPQHHLTLSDINPSRRSITTLKHELVDQMVEVLGLQCLEVTREVFMDMNRTDLVKKLSDSSSASEGQLCSNTDNKNMSHILFLFLTDMKFSRSISGPQRNNNCDWLFVDFI